MRIGPSLDIEGRYSFIGSSAWNRRMGMRCSPEKRKRARTSSPPRSKHMGVKADCESNRLFAFPLGYLDKCVAIGYNETKKSRGRLL